MKQSAQTVRARRGRPRKFVGPSRPVTLTLPLDVIDALSAVDVDLSRAIVRVAQPERARRLHPPAELATFGRRAVIVVNPSRRLEERTGVDLVPLPDGRALICLEDATTPAGLELKIADALEDRRLRGADRRIFEAIADILKSARRSTEVVLLRRNIIMLEGRQARRSPAPRSRSNSRKPKKTMHP